MFSYYSIDKQLINCHIDILQHRWGKVEQCLPGKAIGLKTKSNNWNINCHHSKSGHSSLVSHFHKNILDSVKKKQHNLQTCSSSLMIILLIVLCTTDGGKSNISAKVYKLQEKRYTKQWFIITSISDELLDV